MEINDERARGAIRAGLRLLQQHYTGEPLTSQTVKRLATADGRWPAMQPDEIFQLERRLEEAG